MPADLARQARDLIEDINRAVLDHPGMTAPQIHDTARALMSLAERLPQAFEQLADVLELRAGEDAIRMDTEEDPAAAARDAAEGLRAAGAEADGLARGLAKPASTLSSMAHQGPRPVR